MMTQPNAHWTTEDLELFHDEQLEAARASRLTDDLRCDAVLRARLAEVRRVDDVLRKAMLQPRAVRSLALRFGGALAAACVMLLVGAGWLVWSRTGGTVDAPPAMTKGPDHSSVRVVFSLSLPVGWKTDVAQRRDDGQPSRGKSDGDSPSRLAEALLGGRVEEAAFLLATAPPEERHAGYRVLGEVLQSAEAAEQILDRLSPGEQLAVCNEWAAEAAIRPTVFSRLRRLSAEPSLAEEAKSVLSELSTDPELRAWVRGYGLQEPG